MNRIGAYPLLIERAAALTSTRTEGLARALPVRTLLFLLLHVPLAILMHWVSAIATLHALGTFAVGMWWALSGRRLERVAYIGAYIVGAEVLWRMTDAQVFWEFGKYAAALIFIVATLRKGRIKAPVLPVVYFLLLVPSAVLTVGHLDWGAGRQLLSFNLSGPFALMVSVWFFSHLKLSREQVNRFFLLIIGPVIGVASITVYSILTASTIYFGRTSNTIASGGFGPNQVSAVLGLGALLSFLLCVVSGRRGRGFRALMFGAMIFFATQSALTFSRGGLYLAMASAALASFYLFRDTRSRAKLVLVTMLLFVVANFIVLPRLETFSNGTISARFHDLDPTGRDRIVQSDLQIWAQNPIFGVGPGMAASYRALLRMRPHNAHTEFTRLLAEHGILGCVALLLLLTMAMQSLTRVRTARCKALIISMLGWSFLYMLINAMRLVAPAFMFALGSAAILPEENYRYPGLSVPRVEH